MNAVAKVEQGQISTAVMSPMAIMQLASDKSFELERVEKLMDIYGQWRKIYAEEAFNRAIAAFKADPPQVVKDALNKQYNSMYATIGNIVNTVNPALGKHGLSTTWDIDQSNGIKVTCIMEHFEGHKKSVSMVGPPDNSGSKNALQQIRSTLTYLKVATFEAVTGIVAANNDDDGNSAGGATITEDQARNIELLQTEVGANLTKFLVYMKADSIRSIKAKDYQLALSALEAKRGK